MLLPALAVAALAAAETPLREEQLIFAPQALHNHGSCVVDLPNGDLLACWYRGHGERSADDVVVMGSRLRRGRDRWTTPFVMADTPGFPDCNPCMVVDPRRRLWLFWPVILDNHWESALLKCRTSRSFQQASGAPTWEWQDVVHLKPGPEFLAAVERDLEKQWEPARAAASPEDRQRLKTYLAERKARAASKLSVRLGWMPRPHPYVLDGVRLIVPLYSDGFDFSLMAYTDDWGATWQTSAPLVGPGNVQPSLVRRRDGALVAYFRDNGPAPQRVMVSESRDRAQTWTLAHDIDLPDPGAGLEAIVLRSGRWLLVNNDTEQGRHSLAISISEDEGRTWPWSCHLERDERGPAAGSYSYPSIVQAPDGTIDVTYSYTPSRAAAARLGEGESIKHVRLNEAWLLANRKRR